MEDLYEQALKSRQTNLSQPDYWQVRAFAIRGIYHHLLKRMDNADEAEEEARDKDPLDADVCLVGYWVYQELLNMVGTLAQRAEHMERLLRRIEELEMEASA